MVTGEEQNGFEANDIQGDSGKGIIDTISKSSGSDLE